MKHTAAVGFVSKQHGAPDRFDAAGAATGRWQRRGHRQSDSRLGQRIAIAAEPFGKDGGIGEAAHERDAAMAEASQMLDRRRCAGKIVRHQR